MYFFTLLLILASFGLNHCLLFGSGKNPSWYGLRVTWGINPFRSFKHLPRTIEAAERAGWTRNGGCNENAFYRGTRYILNNDPAVMLLYDKNGYIAGIQSGIVRNNATFLAGRKYRNMFVHDQDKYVVTAYFVDPSIICSKGRTEEEFSRQGTGTGLYIQMGSTPSSLETIPLQESDLSGSTWTKGGCFYTMGRHYWRNITEDMSCKDIEPLFLMYNGGKLNAFGWAFDVDLSSRRYEHPPPSEFHRFLVPVPKCLYNMPNRLSTQHIYFNNPFTNWC